MCALPRLMIWARRWRALRSGPRCFASIHRILATYGATFCGSAKRRGVDALEANSYFSRPGPRLVTGIEALAGVFHPGMKVGEEAQHAALRLAALPLSARAASI